jgi:hypothetical protein
MASEIEMVDCARRATGDEIMVAGLFTRRSDAPLASGAHDRRRTSRSAFVNPWARNVAGPAAASRAAEFVVAIAPTRVYLLRRSHVDPGFDDTMTVAHTFDRRRVAATIHTRLDGRTLTLEDTWTGERFELVGERSPGAHVTATMHALSDIHEVAS